MTGPGGDEVGRVSIRVVPDTSGFRQRLKAAVEAAERDLEVTIPVNFDADIAGLRAQLRALDNSRVTIPVDIGDGSEIERLRARLQALDGARLVIPLEIGDGGEIERLRARLETLEDTRLQVRVSVTGATRGINMLLALEEVVERLDGRNVRIRVDVDGLASAVAQMGALEAASSNVGNAVAQAGRAGTREFGRLDSVARGVVGALAQAVVLAPAIAVAGAGITAAWGAASTAIAAIPGLIAGAAAVIGTVAAGLDGIKNAAKTIKPEFDALRKSVSDTFERGFVQVFRTLATTFPTLTTGMDRVAVSITGIAQRLADMLASNAGLLRLRSIFDGMSLALDKMSPGIAAVVDSILILGSQSVIFDTLASAVNTFGQEFRRSVIDLIERGTLDRAMTGLRGSLESLTRGFVGLVENGIELFAAAAPGVNQFLDSLTRFFGRFNWDSLGRSVGRVFSGLAETLDQVDDQTIRDIEQAFADLADTFNDPKFQENLRKIIEGIPAAVRQLGELSKAFGEVGAAISGMLIAFDAVDKPFREFVQGISDNIDKLRRAMAGENGLDPEDPFGLKLLDDNPVAFLNVLMINLRIAFDRLRTVVQIGIESVRAVFSQGWGLVATPVQIAFDQIVAVVTLGMRQIQAAVTLGVQAVQTALTLGWQSVIVGTQIAWQQIPLYVGLGMQTAQLAVQTGMTLLKTAMQLGWQQVQLAAQLAWQLLPTYVQLGFTTMQLAVQTGMTLLKTAMTLGWQQVQLATSMAWQLIPTYVSLGFAAVQTAITTGISLAQTAMQVGWSQIQTLTGLAWSQIQTAVSVAWGVITSSTSTGTSQVSSAVSTAWSQIQALTGTAWATITSTIQTAVNNFVSAVRTGAGNVLAEMRALPGRIVSAIGNLGSLLVSAGRALMDGLLSGIRAGFEAVLAFARSIAARIAAVKGPRQYDLRVLRPAGEWLMRGLGDGLSRGMDLIVGMVRRFTGTFAGLQFQAPQLANVREFVSTGASIGDALLDGLNTSQPAIIAAAREITDRLNAEFARVDASSTATAFDDVSARLHGQLDRSSAELDAALVDRGQSGKQITIQTTINNPLPETGSDSVAQTHRRQAAMGIFG